MKSPELSRLRLPLNLLGKSRAGSARNRASEWLDLILPPRSLLTGEPISLSGETSGLWGSLQFLDDPCCVLCGFPFDYDMGGDVPCGRCAARAPAYDQARAAVRYDDASRKMVLDFKHGGWTQGLDMFAVQMRRAGRTILPDADYLVPVPLHPSRLRRRRYNQAALLAKRLAGLCETARFEPNMLQRIKRTPSQGGKSVSGRRRNMSGAFAVRPSGQGRVRGAHIILIDDVFTTGATLESCARTLKKAGAARVDGLTLARVVKPAQIPT